MTDDDRQAVLDALTDHQRVLLLAWLDAAAPGLVDEGLAWLGAAEDRSTT